MIESQDPSPKSASFIQDIMCSCEKAMNDDFNSARVISELFFAIRFINQMDDTKGNVARPTLFNIKEAFDVYFFDVLGIKDETEGDNKQILDGLMKLVLSIRQKSRETKDWGTSDQIRDTLQNLHITVKDGKEGSTWEIE